MKRNKELFFNFSKSGKRLDLKLFRKEPVEYKYFVEVISCLKDTNIENSLWLRGFYDQYKNDIFPNIISKSPRDYSKYFWNSKCLNLDYPASSDDFYLSRGWSHSDIKDIRKKKYATSSLKYQRDKYGLTEEGAKKKLDKRQSTIKRKRKITYENYLKEDPDYFKKVSGYSIDHFLYKGYGLCEAIRLHEESSESVSNKNKKWAHSQKENNPEYWSSRTETQLAYWLQKCNGNLELAKEKLRNRQVTFSLEKCIERYGEKTGRETWEKRNKEWSLLMEEKYLNGEYDRAPKSLNTSQHSKICNELLDRIVGELGLDESTIQYYNNKELSIRTNSGNIKYYDFFYKSKGKIIEFHGDYWHCNPKIYEAEYIHPIKDMSAKKIWKYDQEKIRLAKNKGYDVLVIWEDDYRNSPKTIINKCIQYLYD